MTGLRFLSIAVAIAALPASARGLSFSVAPGAVGGGGAACVLGAADICSSAGAGANATLLTAAMLGLLPGDDVDAASFNSAPPPPPFPAFGAVPLLFSVAPGALGPGLPGAPDPGAIYSSVGGGVAALSFGSAALGLALGDDVDGFDLASVLATSIFFSLAPGSPSLGALFAPGDIFVSLGAGAFALFINAESLGLCTFRVPICGGMNDNLDALVVNTDAWIFTGLLPPAIQTGGGLLFSVGPGTIGPGLPAGTLPGDVLFSAGGGVSGLYAPAAALGLAAGDNLDALEIPEPGTLGLLTLAALTWAARVQAAAKRTGRREARRPVRVRARGV